MSDSIQRLHEAVLKARRQDPRGSRTARLLGKGMPKMAKKLAEEAVEVGLEAVQGHRSETIRESADLIYNLVVLWSEAGIAPVEIWAEMDRREQLYGIAEKLAKTRTGKAAGRSEAEIVMIPPAGSAVIAVRDGPSATGQAKPVEFSRTGVAKRNPTR